MRKRWFGLGLIALWIIPCGCSFRGEEDDIIHGTISYPFIRTNPLGQNGPREKLVIKSIQGSKQYVVEFPNEGETYDLEIPMAINVDESGQPNDQPQNLASPSVTDQEMVRALPDVAKNLPQDSRLIDKAFGVGSGQKPAEAPSYSMGLAKVSNFYKMRKYEYALIELNNLLAFYPNSPRFWKMKGTIYQRMHNYDLAEQSWLKALELEPYDKVLQKSLASLQEKKKSLRSAEPALLKEN